MRNIIYILLALALLSGCQKHNVPSDNILPGRYIFFDASIQETKSNLVEGDKLPTASGTDFGVFGYRPGGAPIFDMYTSDNSAIANVARVYWKEDEGPFVYDALALWHNGQHNFYAYYPYDNAKTVIDVPFSAENFSEKPYIIYTQPTSLDDMVDVMTAHIACESSAGEVKFNFAHRLFALDIIINNEHDSRDFNIDTVEVKFKAPSKAKLYYDDTSSYVEDMADFSFATENITLTANKDSIINGQNSFLFVPCSSLDVSVVIYYTNAWDGKQNKREIDKTISPENAPGFEGGKKYEFLIKRNNNDIEIKINDEVYAWDKSYDIDVGFN